MRYFLIIVYLFFTTGGMTLMKLGGDSLKLDLRDGFSFSMSWKTFLGFLFYLVSFLIWQRLLVKYELTIMVPIVTGIVQVIILCIGYLVFKESCNILSLIGAGVVILGIIIMGIANR